MELDSQSIRVVPLAGLGQFGLNCLCLEARDGIVVVDCGAKFPRDDLGVEMVHADYSWLHERASRVRGVVLTHGHEDHIGGVPMLLADLSVPVFGPPHAIAMVRRRLEESGLSSRAALLHDQQVGERLSLGPFEVEPFRVSHSIVEATALLFETPAGRVFHTGDFNFDPEPSDGEATDEELLSAIGDAGVRLLLSDSTNIDTVSAATSEADVARCLSGLIDAVSKRVIVAVFSSNIQRLLTLGDIAQATGRRICLLGRSVENHVDIARSLGRLSWPSSLLISKEALERHPDAEVMVIAGGTQAEYHSNLSRIARDDHRYLRRRHSDTVIFSSRIIPGNEPAVFEMMGSLLRSGMTLHSRETDPGVHTSGHATREEQRRMLRAIRPSAFIPLHGTLHHLRRHAELAREEGVPVVEVIENGQPVTFDGERLERDSEVRAGVVNRGRAAEVIDDDALRDRASLSRSGVVFVSVPRTAPCEPAGEIRIKWLGVPGLGDRAGVESRLGGVVETALHRFRNWRKADLDLEREVGRAIRKGIDHWVGGRPEVVVQFLEVGPGEDGRS